MNAANRDPQIIEMVAALAAPFDPKEIKFKAQTVKGNRALAVGFVDARLIQDRLDDVMGVENWQDRYTFLPDGSVVCTLRVFIGGRWIAKTDVGSPSEQPDAGDRMKAAVSDALKRTAVKLGIGRYLYRLPAVWCDYDPVKKQLTQLPQLPAWAVPKTGAARQQPQPAPKPAGGQHVSPPQGNPAEMFAVKPIEKPAPATAPAGADPVAWARYQEAEAAWKAVGWEWPKCVAWLNDTYPSEPVKYTAKTRFSEIEIDRVARLVRYVNTLAVAGK